MTSILLRASCNRDLKASTKAGGGYPTSSPGSAYLDAGVVGGGYHFDFQSLVKTAADRARQGGEGVPSRGVRLLLKAKPFHLAVRGLQETTGFRFISDQPKRQGSIRTSTGKRYAIIRVQVSWIPVPGMHHTSTVHCGCCRTHGILRCIGAAA